MLQFSEFIAQHEIPVRLSSFFSILIVMGIWELIAPRRALTVAKTVRWINNLGLVLFNSIMLRLLFPAAAVGMAALSAELGWGLLNYYPLPLTLTIIISVVALDFVVYLQHVLVHAIPVLWRIHRVHHADLDYDVTTGLRFHPFEIFLSMLIKFTAIMIIGAPVIAVIIFEVILNALAMFNHSNVRIPFGLDRVLRLVIVTPDMHRVHHSTEENEANSNFGFNLSVWDRILGTYIAQPRLGHEKMNIGIHQFRDAKQVSLLPGLLSMPFKGKLSGYAINRHKWSRLDDE